jgi:hypothetical protein
MNNIYYYIIIIVIGYYIISELLGYNKNNVIISNKDNNMRWAILLTSCVRTKKADDPRMGYYLDSIKNWLDKTSLPIFIVESSNYTFPEFANTRLKVCSFNLTNEPGPSQYEAKSIKYAMEYFKDDLKPYTHIMKVTGRYFVDIEKILPTLNNVNIILQSSHNDSINWNNSEIFGFRIGIENQFLDPILKDGLMEETIYKYAHFHYQRLPPIRNTKKIKRGGDSLIIDPL